jgi:hypothetical protein
MSKNQEPIMSNPRIPSRRTFLRNASLAAVAAPILTEAHFARAQQQQVYTFGVNHPLPPDTALINANENPLGPSKAAIEAIAKISSAGGRYDIYNQNEILLKTVATQMNLKPEYVALYPGSSEPLHWTVLGFTSPGHGLVTADPSYEAPMAAAMVNKAPIARVRLAADLSHDMKAMVAADPNAGVIYICNPNNPTGTITAREDILWALEHKPAGSVLLVDEAYIHLSDAQSVVDMVAAGKDLRHGGHSLRACARPARPAEEDRLLQREQRHADHRAGGRNRLAQRSGSDPDAQEDHRRHPPRDSRLAEEQQLQGSGRSAVELLHDRHRTPRPHGRAGDAGEGRHHRALLAHLAVGGTHLRGNAGRDGEVPHRVQGSDGCAGHLVSRTADACNPPRRPAYLARLGHG